MNIAEHYLALCSKGIDLVADAAQCSADEWLVMGVQTSDAAKSLQHLANVYFGPAAGAGPAKAQQTCVALARQHRLSLGELEDIETFVQKARTTTDAWTLREILIATPTDRRVRVAAKKLAELNP